MTVPYLPTDNSTARRGAWVVARLVAGAPVDEHSLEALPEPWRDVACAVAAANGAGRLSALLDALDHRSDAEELKAAVFAIDPNTDPAATPGPTRQRFRLMTVDEVTGRPDPAWQIDGHLVENSLSVLYGPTGTGKTLLAIEEACSTVSGRLYLGLEQVTQGIVVIIAAEGLGGLGKRIRAWQRRHPDADLSRLYILGEAVDFLNPADVDALLAGLAALPEKPIRIYVDTFARCMTGDENSAKDVGAFIRAVDRVRAETGAHVRLVHHTGKSGELERGSSALRAAADTMTCLAEEGDTQALTCTKQKDAEPFKKLRLRIVVVPEEDSVVLEWVDRADDGATLTPKTRQALEALDRHFTEEGATATEWQTVAGLPQQTYYRAKKLLIEGGYVKQDGRKHVLTSVGRDALATPEPPTPAPTTGLPGDSHILQVPRRGAPRGLLGCV